MTMRPNMCSHDARTRVRCQARPALSAHRPRDDDRSAACSTRRRARTATVTGRSGSCGAGRTAAGRDGSALPPAHPGLDAVRSASPPRPRSPPSVPGSRQATTSRALARRDLVRITRRASIAQAGATAPITRSRRVPAATGAGAPGRRVRDRGLHGRRGGARRPVRAVQRRLEAGVARAVVVEAEEVHLGDVRDRRPPPGRARRRSPACVDLVRDGDVLGARVARRASSVSTCQPTSSRWSLRPLDRRRLRRPVERVPERLLDAVEVRRSRRSATRSRARAGRSPRSGTGGS